MLESMLNIQLHVKRIGKLFILSLKSQVHNYPVEITSIWQKFKVLLLEMFILIAVLDVKTVIIIWTLTSYMMIKLIFF
jgi:hypothetical protein